MPEVPWPHYTIDDVALHNRWNDCWIVVHDAVYDVTPHCANHEGWANRSKQSTLLAILSAMGQDCTEDFDEPHSDWAKQQILAFQIGVLDVPNRGKRSARRRSWEQLLEAGVVPCTGLDGGRPNADELHVVNTPCLPASLVTLDAQLLQRILCEEGSLRSVKALACSTSSLHEAMLSLGSLVLPTVGPPDKSASCPMAVVAWEDRSGILRKTDRLGHAVVTPQVEPLSTLNAVFQLDVLRLPAVACLHIGLRGHAELPTTSKGPPTATASQHWFNCAGRVLAFEGVPPVPSTHTMGERVRDGDRVGVVFLAYPKAVGFLINGKLIGPPLALPAGSRFFRFAVRFDHVPGTEVRMVRTTSVPFDLRTLLHTAALFTPRPLPESETKGVLVRTLGPDSRTHIIPLDVDVATVSQLAEKVAVLLECDAWHQVSLTCNGRPLLRLDQGHGLSVGMLPDATLREASNGDVALDPRTNCQLHDVIASLPHLIS